MSEQNNATICRLRQYDQTDILIFRLNNTGGCANMNKILTPPTPKDIKDLRIKTELTASQSANLLHITTRSFQRYERGNTIMPLAYWELFELKCRVIHKRNQNGPMA